MGYCLYGNDINEKTTPIEASLKWITKTDKNFIGKNNILFQIKNIQNKKLVGFKLEERGIPRHDYEIFDNDDEKIGVVTSGTMSPVLKQGIGLGYVDIKNSKIESVIYIKIRSKKIKASVVKLPFVKI